MISHFFSRMLGSLGMVLRMFRAFFLRRFMGIGTRVKQLTSASRYAAKILPKAASSVAVVGKKPTRREDYLETRRLYIAKSLIVTVILVLVALAALIYFVAWPWMLSRYFTAHYYVDSKAASAHTGKVVLYYDEEKTSPYFKGALTEGAIQGAGEEYDENGLVVYAGDYASGAYSGSGRLYEDGALVYEGEFSGGAFNGRGKLFSGGAVEYDGQFRDGALNGEGAQYNSGGTAIYRGGFANGLYDSTGAQYGDDGALIFKGEFSEGKRNGAGRLFLDENLTMEANFENGAPAGAVKIMSGGFLAYEGAVSGARPHGYGALYAPQSGQVVYRGGFVNGRPDGAAALGLSVAGAAELFGESPPSDASGGSYFGFVNDAAGFALLFPLRRGEDEPLCSKVYLYEPADADLYGRELPWRNAAEYDAYIESAGELWERDEGISAGELFSFGYGEYYRVEYKSPDGAAAVTLWSREKGGDAFAVTWAATGDAFRAPEDAPPSEDEMLAARIDQILTDFGLAPPPDPGAAGEAYEEIENPYYGERSVSGLLMDLSSDELYARLEAMGEYMSNAEKRMIYDRQREILDGRMERLKGAPVVNEGAVKTLDTRIKGLQLGASSCAVAMERASDRAGGDLSQYDVKSALLIIDPSAIDVADIIGAATAVGETGLADVKDMMLDAELEYQKLRLAQEELAASVGELDTARADFAQGRLGMAQLEEAQLAAQDKAAAICDCLQALSGKLTELDRAGGWLLSVRQARFTGVIESIKAEPEPEPPPPGPDNADMGENALLDGEAG
ncbi:MAG: hypothetical protein LBJ84_02835 [Oscillospiraceae bacterium]|jgi:hypothetical protein|nr:hypothetical protein [Oscillospiraceae bacterium]